MTIRIQDKKVQAIVDSIDKLADHLDSFRPSADTMHITQAQYKLFRREAKRNLEFKRMFAGGEYRGYKMEVLD